MIFPRGRRGESVSVRSFAAFFGGHVATSVAGDRYVWRLFSTAILDGHVGSYDDGS